MPDRHSTPANPRSTIVSTSRSQLSPAPAVISESSPSRVVVIPLMPICTTRPSKPRSAITTLLPPPSTNHGMRCSSHHRRAAATSSACSARTNQRAAPPTPSVPSAASETLARGASTLLERKNRPFLRDQRRHGLVTRADLELDPVAWRELAGERQIRGDHRRDLWITTGGLSIGHQQDRIARGRHLQCAGKRRVRDHLAAVEMRNRGTG